jgi:hypothetical protein
VRIGPITPARSLWDVDPQAGEVVGAIGSALGFAQRWGGNHLSSREETLMNRATGTSFIGFGLVLVMVGAVLRFAVTANPDGFDIETAGLIAIWVGIVSTLIGLLFVVLGGNRKSTLHERFQETPTGSERIQERDDFSV